MKNIEIKIVNLKNRLRNLCSDETAHPLCKDNWTSSNPFLGHDAVVTAIAFHKFGGDIIRGIIAETGFSHYWNCIDGIEYDLTKEQFDGKFITLIETQDSNVDRILNNPETKQRYDILLSRLKSLEEESNDTIN